MSEQSLMDAIVKAARSLNYLVFHAHDARKSEPGFPDLVIVGHSRIFAVECKSANGKLRPATVDRKGRVLPGQSDWLDAFRESGAESGVVRPDDLDYMLALLKRGYEEKIA